MLQNFRFQKSKNLTLGSEIFSLFWENFSYWKFSIPKSRITRNRGTFDDEGRWKLSRFTAKSTQNWVLFAKALWDICPAGLPHHWCGLDESPSKLWFFRSHKTKKKHSTSVFGSFLTQNLSKRAQKTLISEGFWGPFWSSDATMSQHLTKNPAGSIFRKFYRLLNCVEVWKISCLPLDFIQVEGLKGSKNH